MTETTGWTRCQYGQYVKEINGYYFRLWRGSTPGTWEVTMENVIRPTAHGLSDAKRLAHDVAERVGVMK